MHVSSRPFVRPLLKWAGGKRQLLSALERHYPHEFSRYVEPFVGSGAVFFHLLSIGRLDGRKVLLADVNPDLIGCYRMVRDRTDQVVSELARVEREHRAGGGDCYYRIRDELFNPRRAVLFGRAADGGPAVEDSYTPALAAMLIYLNRTGFNGLFRLNRHGGFNVPAGRYAEPRICDPAHVHAVAEALGQPAVTLVCRTFDGMIEDTGDGDFVYCDPPYAPLSRTASFAHYTAGGFGPFDQKRLQMALVKASHRGAWVVMSNSSAPEIVRAYTSRDAKDARLVLSRVPARRAINSRASSRGPVDEVIVSNVLARSRKLGESALPRPRMARVDAPGKRKKTA